jgi:hypothetical protein
MVGLETPKAEGLGDLLAGHPAVDGGEHPEPEVLTADCDDGAPGIVDA